MTQEDYIGLFTSNLDLILDSGVGNENDFVSLAIAGEQLRRALIMADTPSEVASRSVARYDLLLSEGRQPVPSGLESDMDKVIKELRAFAARPVLKQSTEDCEELLIGVDEILSVAAASLRAGVMKKEDLLNLSNRTRAEIAELAPLMVTAWEFAEEREQLFGPDPDVPGLHGWCEELASYSQSRAMLDVSSSLLDQDKKASMIREVLGHAEVIDFPGPTGKSAAPYRIAAAPGLQEGEDRLVATLDEGIEVSLSRSVEGFIIQLVSTRPERIGQHPEMELPDCKLVKAEREGPRAWVFGLGASCPASVDIHLEIDGSRRIEKIDLEPA